MRPLSMGVVAGVLLVGVTGAALAQGDDPPPPVPAPAPAQPQKIKRVVFAVELATGKKERFQGSVTLRIASGQRGPDLKYHWGGKCKGTKVSSSRLDLLMTAMEKGYAVEIPAEPISHDGRIYMCAQSIRILNE